MCVQDVHKMSPLFQPYTIKLFEGYLNTIKKNTLKKRERNNWKKSEAKKKLCSLLENDSNGSIHAMRVEDAHKLSLLFEAYSIDNFR